MGESRSGLRRIWCLAVAWALVATGAWAQDGAAENEVSFGLGTRHTITSAALGGRRDVIIRLPSDYEKTGWSYPVLYLLGSDFRPRMALAAAGLEYMAAQGQVPPIVLVGVELPEGNFGLVPRDESDGGTKSADRYARFLTDELFPFVERSVRANGYRICYGGSNSGMGVLYGLFSDLVDSQATIASSPMLGWSPELIFELTRRALQGPKREPHVLFLLASDDDFGRVTRHFADYVSLLEKEAPAWLRWRSVTRSNEGHVPEADLTLALRAIFEGYNPVEKLLDAGALREYYEALSQVRGMTIEPPSALLFDVGFNLVSGGEAQKGQEVFELYVERYPWHAMAHAGLGFALKEQGEAEASRMSLQEALELDADNRFAQRLLRELDE